MDGIENIASIAPLRNVAAFLEMFQELKTADPGLPRMGVFHGPAGFGKSTAAIFATNMNPSCLVQMKSYYTRRAFCEAVLKELGVRPTGTLSDMVGEISRNLAKGDLPLLIDEAHILADKKMIELVRDIYENTFVPVILIGEEVLPQRLRRWERVHSRILIWTAAQPGTKDDFEHLRKLRCPDLNIDAKVTKKVLEASRGSLRRMTTNLVLIRRQAEVKGITNVTEKDLDQSFYTGEAPDPRRGLA